MRFLIDANLPRSTTELLRRLGHQFEFARDIGFADAPDEAIAARARTTAAVLLTRDLDFSDVRRYPPGDYSGIVVVRAPDDAVASTLVQIIERFLSEPTFLSQLQGRLAIVETDRVRFRPPLSP